MSFTVNFYQFSKKENSTKRPSGSPTASYDCTVRTSTGIINPTIELDLGLLSDPSHLNYCHIPTFDRYYFVREWVFGERLWECSLQVDVLATYKNAIGSSSLYVLRAANDYDGRVVDHLYPTKVDCDFSTELKSVPWDSPGSGCFVIGVNTKNPRFGSLSYYVVDDTAMSGLIQGLIDTAISVDNGFDLDEFSAGLQLALVDPIQYIKSAVFIPLSYGTLPGQGIGGTITVFNYPVTTGGSVKEIRWTTYVDIIRTFEVPKHPQTDARGNYVNVSPYTVASLYFPPFGVIELDTTALSDVNEFTVEVRVDVTNGLGILQVKANGILLNRLEAQIGVPVQLSQVVRDYLGAFNNIMGAMSTTAHGVGSILSGNVGGAVGSFFDAVAGVGNAAASLVPRSQSIGGGGSYAQLYENPRADFQFFEIVDDDIMQNGRPLCQMRTPANLGGYMLIQDGDVSITGTLEESKQVKAYLETGFYYE